MTLFSLVSKIAFVAGAFVLFNNTPDIFAVQLVAAAGSALIVMRLCLDVIAYINQKLYINQKVIKCLKR